MDTGNASLDPGPPLGSILGVQGYNALVSVLLVLLVPPQLFLSILTIAGLCTGKTFRKVTAQRNTMIAMAASGFISSLAVTFFAGAFYLYVNHHTQAGVVFCHGGALLSHINFGVRNLLLVTLSVTIYITIKYNLKKIKIQFLNLALALMLPYVTILGVVYFIPPAIDASEQFDGVLCRYKLSPGGYVGVILPVFFIDAPARIVSIAIIIATYRHIRSTVVTSDKKIKISMLKFCVMLLVINLITWVCGWVGLVPVVFQQINRNALLVLTVYNSFPLNSILGIVTPLMMICVFRPLRESIKQLAAPLCHCFRKVIQSGGDPSSPNTPHTSETAVN